MPFLSLIPTTLCIQRNAILEILMVVKIKVKIFWDVMPCNLAVLMISLWGIYHHHHQFLLSLRGHTASTKHCHLVLFPAILLTSFQLFPLSNASLWTVLRHVCLGLPLLLFPCGFQSKACLSMTSCPFLSVCPIQFHFRLLICVDILISLVLLQSSSFEITSGQWMFRICCKQGLTKVCSLEAVVFISFHVPDPYNNTDLTLLQKMWSLVLADILLFFHTR